MLKPKPPPRPFIEDSALELERLRATNTELRLFKITVVHALRKHAPELGDDPVPTDAETVIGQLARVR